MKLSFLLLIAFPFSSFCQTEDSTSFQADKPYIRFGEQKINLYGKWCHVTIDSSHWTIRKAIDSSLIYHYNCNGLLFDQHGKANEYLWGDYFSKPPLIKYSIKDSILELIIPQKESLVNLRQYIVTEFTGQEITFKKIYDSSEDPIIPKVEAHNVSSRTDSLQHLIANSSGIGFYAPVFSRFFPIGQSGQKINQGINFNPGLLINLKKVRLMLSFSQLIGTIKDSFNYGQEYLKDRELKTLSYEICGGYAVGQNKFLTVIPMIGAGITHHEVINPDSFMPFTKTATYFTCSFRIAVDFNVLKAYTRNTNNKKTGVGLITIRTMAGYYPLIYQTPFKFSGGTAFASIGMILQFGWFPRATKKMNS